ncbi:MAG: hypothetical protein J6T10_22555 [Methanobrevibacter sp.]|nr:hypothetical protein [Methanobrevibacter sp.]
MKKVEKKFLYKSKNTGQLVTNIIDLIKVTIIDFHYYKVINRWQYNKDGF